LADAADVEAVAARSKRPLQRSAGSMCCEQCRNGIPKPFEEATLAEMIA